MLFLIVLVGPCPDPSGKERGRMLILILSDKQVARADSPSAQLCSAYPTMAKLEGPHLNDHPDLYRFHVYN